MDATDEPYDFLTWHSNAPAVKDEKKEKKKLKKSAKEAEAKAAKVAKKDSASKKENKKRKRSSDSSSDDDSDKEDDHDDKNKNKKSKSKAVTNSSSQSESESESASDSSSSEDSDDPDTQPPPKSKRKKVRKKDKKAQANNSEEEDGDEAEAPENADNDGEDNKKKKKKDKKDKSKKKEGPGRKGEFGIWIGNLSFLTTEKALRHFFRNVGAEITRVNMPSGSGFNKKGNKGFAYVDFETAEAQENAIKLSESELEGRKVLIKSSKSFEGRPAVSKGELQGKALKQKHAVSPTLFIGNLSFQTTKESLQKLFEDCGEIRKVRLATFEDSGKCKGFAYIDYMAPESASAALTDPAKRFLDGRKLNIEYASAEATLRGNPREYRKHKRDEEKAAAIARGEIPADDVDGGENSAGKDATDEAAEEERRRFNAEQKAKRQRRQPGDGSKPKKLQGHQRPGFALANAQRASQGITEFKGNKITFS
ncbi:hypothetical protein BX616_004273 [Lobosporangium transversale]|uniref:RRM domain-containing protein n=1 Tax=Lobosporangium transversale TaxID=64571 RepID=A0A1Y2GL48_9FUNG|nr:hypothetical protein BCR41DRAFT_337137 [Lobosporangium transversale]KAF9898259.1 hypothetical protein BX616_004273 [Lobosporangium transversale]ORZ14280.1 hypothetical protein BCR41DRAFT_337137 [Lobosporangium transversale]|eukprot:XP_021880758.1 hypothetical protein BCR41DRAFT_337137 [Lobosporangium transversale]